MKKWLRRNRAGIIGAVVIALILTVIYALTTNVYADAVESARTLHVYWIQMSTKNECVYLWRGYTGYYQVQGPFPVYWCAVIR